MQLHDYYKKYGSSFLGTIDFMKQWGGTVPFKLMDNRICSDSLSARRVITERLNNMFKIDSVPETVHHTLMKAYFECLIEYNLMPENTDYKNRLYFKSDKIRIFNKGDINFRRPNTLAYPQNYEKERSVDRVVFSNSIFVTDENQYNFYTVLSNYGSGGIDHEFMKFSYCVIDDNFYFHPPKLNNNLDIALNFPLIEIDEHLLHIKKLIKKKLFSSFYENICPKVFRRVLDFESFNDIHFEVLKLLSGYSIGELVVFMEENDYMNDIISLSDTEILDLYKVSLTTFEMIKI